MATASQLWVCVFDLHCPVIHWPTWNVALEFLSKNKVDGFLFGGDQMDNAEIAHHNAGKPLFKPQGSYQRNEELLKKEVLKPLMGVVPKTAKRVWIVGNHDRFEADFIETNPEFDGIVNRVQSLKLKENGWQVVPLGHAYKLGKLNVCHGEIITGWGNQGPAYAAKKALELYTGNVLCGHTHSPQMFTKVSPVENNQKWQAYISPVACETNPTYLRNRPTAWVNGIDIVEIFPDGQFNCYLVNTFNGRFSFGGRIYQG